MVQRKFNVAVAGATGAVGNQMIRCLEELNFPVNSVTFLASSRSVGRQLRFKGDLVEVKELKEDSFKGIDIALFSAGGGTSQRFAPLAAKDGCVFIDNSSAWRMYP
jgi:aspartate-semialdehyde dehydrogenase